MGVLAVSSGRFGTADHTAGYQDIFRLIRATFMLRYQWEPPYVPTVLPTGVPRSKENASP